MNQIGVVAAAVLLLWNLSLFGRICGAEEDHDIRHHHKYKRSSSSSSSSSLSSSFSSSSSSSAPITTNVTVNNTFIVFETQWKPEYCYHNDAPNCNDPNLTQNVTIHGMWPSTFDGSDSPFYCRDIPFTPQDVQSIEPQLAVYWPTLSSANSDFDFWTHEWDKHGTCWFIDATPLPYFQQGLTYIQKYNIQQTLASAGILPSNTVEYATQSVLKALSSMVNGKRTGVWCNAGRYIVEFSVCFDYESPDLVIDCPASYAHSTCQANVILVPV